MGLLPLPQAQPRCTTHWCAGRTSVLATLSNTPHQLKHICWWGVSQANHERAIDINAKAWVFTESHQVLAKQSQWDSHDIPTSWFLLTGLVLYLKHRFLISARFVLNRSQFLLLKFSYYCHHFGVDCNVIGVRGLSEQAAAWFLENQYRWSVCINPRERVSREMVIKANTFLNQAYCILHSTIF